MLLFLWSPSSSHLQIFVEDFRGFVLGEYSTLNHVSGPSEAGDRFEHQGIFTKYTELFCEIQQFNHTQGRLLLTQASCRQHRLVKASFGRACPKRCRQTQEPLLLSVPLDAGQLWSGRCYSSRCYGFGHVNLGTMLQAKELCSPCTHLFEILFLFPFSWVSLDKHWL